MHFSTGLARGLRPLLGQRQKLDHQLEAWNDASKAFLALHPPTGFETDEAMHRGEQKS